MQTEAESLRLNGADGTLVSKARVAFIQNRPERTLLDASVDLGLLRRPDDMPETLRDLEEGFVWGGESYLEMPLRLTEHNSLRLRFRIRQEGGVGWNLAARRFTRNRQGGSLRPELTLRQSAEGLDIRDLGTRRSQRVQGDAPPEGMDIEYEILMNWDPPAFAVWREGVPIFVSELPGIEGRDTSRHVVFRFPDGVTTSLSQVEISVGDGKLPELRRPQSGPGDCRRDKFDSSFRIRM